MEALTFSVWQLLVEAMASRFPALIAVVGAVLLAQLIARLRFLEWAPLPAKTFRALTNS